LRVTGRPKINSLQSAIVIGPAGAEINADQYGRVQVQFFWDRRASGSGWCRVSQVWAGNHWGAVFTPRVGQEVMVDFVEGNPDFPIVVGRVYNSRQMPPWLPEEKNISGFRSRSTEGGGEHDANVLTFDDTMGQEVFYMRAQKDMAVRVENDEWYHVGHDQNIGVVNDRTVLVHEGDEEVVIEKGNRLVRVKKGDDYHFLNTGDRHASILSGSDTVHAMKSITLQVGQSSIVLDQTGVTIKGLTIQIQADTLLTLQGIPVKIN
jgi:type VI secretion system secreted protein VgrG